MRIIKAGNSMRKGYPFWISPPNRGEPVVLCCREPGRRAGGDQIRHRN
ncbi:hypothetical protein ACFLVN_00410 [Chloroflexota bacterium]